MDAILSPTEDFNLIPYNLPAKDLKGSTLTKFIEREEPIILKKIMGEKMYADWDAALELYPIDEKWTNLMDGIKYTYNGREYKWKGMKEMLRPYIYAIWLRGTVYGSVGVGGLQMPKAENGEYINPIRLIVNAYNDFATMCGTGCGHYGTMYGYIQSIKDEFPDFKFGDPGTMNTFNL